MDKWQGSLRTYLRSMFRALRHPSWAFLIMGLAVLVVVPKRWLHDCDADLHAHACGIVAVVQDNHCTLCETVLLAPVLTVPAMLTVPIGAVELLYASDVRPVPGPTGRLASVRGPPRIG